MTITVRTTLLHDGVLRSVALPDDFDAKPEWTCPISIAGEPVQLRVALVGHRVDDLKLGRLLFTVSRGDATVEVRDLEALRNVQERLRSSGAGPYRVIWNYPEFVMSGQIERGDDSARRARAMVQAVGLVSLAGGPALDLAGGARVLSVAETGVASAALFFPLASFDGRYVELMAEPPPGARLARALARGGAGTSTASLADHGGWVRRHGIKI